MNKYFWLKKAHVPLQFQNLHTSSVPAGNHGYLKVYFFLANLFLFLGEAYK